MQRPWNLRLRTPDFLWNPLQAWVEEPTSISSTTCGARRCRRRATSASSASWCRACTATTIDFHRPPWEVHLIEGLERGRFAIYVKVHHSLVDGFIGDAHPVERAVDAIPNERDRPLFFSIPPPARAAARRGRQRRAASTSPSCSRRCASSTARRRARARALKRCSTASRAGDHELVVAAPGAEVRAQRADQPQPPLRDAAARDRAAQGGREGVRTARSTTSMLALSRGEPAPLPARAGRAARRSR